MRSPFAAKLIRAVHTFAPIWVIVFALPSCAQTKVTSNIHAIVTYTGKIPTNPVPDQAGIRTRLFRVNTANDGLRGALVYLEPMDSKPQADAAPLELPSLKVDQFDEIFVPVITVAHPGQLVTFSNSDTANHNVRATAENPRNEFNIMAGPGGDYEKKFQLEPTRSPIKLSCDIHAWMYAWLYILDHPYYAYTDDNGRCTIPDVPPGSYTLVITHPAGRLLAQSPIRIENSKNYAIEHPFTENDLNSTAQQPVKIVEIALEY